MAISIKFHFQDNTEETKYISASHYHDILTTGNFFGKPISYLKLISSGEYYDFYSKKWYTSESFKKSTGV